MTQQEIMDQIHGKLIVSCQALKEEPLYSSYIMSRMAYAAMEGGQPESGQIPWKILRQLKDGNASCDWYNKRSLSRLRNLHNTDNERGGCAGFLWL